MSGNTVKQLEDLLKDQPSNPMRPNRVAECQEEMDRVRAIAESPPFVQADRGLARRRYIELQRTLDTQAPKPIEDIHKRNQVNQLADQVLNNVIRPTMLPRTVMRRNPAGAVDAHMKGEASTQVKRAIRVWKRAQWALDPTTTDTDHTNLERFRPEGTPDGGTASFMPGAQIPGHHAMTTTAKQNWPLGDPTAKTAVAHLPEVDVEAEPAPANLEVPCACGCRRRFVPRTTNQKYFNKRHQYKANAKKRLIRQEGGEA